MNPIGFVGPGTSFLATIRTLNKNQNAMAASVTRLATGYRINSGRDDPSGLITSEKLRSELSALEAETRTLQRSDFVVTTADAALGEISDLLVEAKGLVIANASTAGMSQAEIDANQMQIDSLVASANRIASTTSFAGQNLLDGSLTITANGATITVDDVSTGDIGTGEEAAAALDAARSSVSTLRGKLGSFSTNTIRSRLNTVAVTVENIATAESAIRDTDFGRETALLARLRIMTEATTLASGSNRSIASTQARAPARSTPSHPESRLHQMATASARTSI